MASSCNYYDTRRPDITMIKVILVLILCIGTLSSETPLVTSEETMMNDGPLSGVSDYLEEYGCNKPVFNRTSVIQDCLKRALHFVRKYLSRLDKGKQFDVCRRFEDVQECLGPILDTCPSFKAKYGSVLNPVMSYLKCACLNKAECMDNLHCFEVEYRGILSQRCDAYYKFNIQQRTHEQCFFVQERVACKVSLVTTACDVRTGEFAYNLYRFLDLHHSKTSQCDVTYVPVDEYEGFYYDENCPTYFLQDLASCSTNHLWNQMLPFDEENDLVSRGTTDDIKTACMAYKSYRKCIRHPRKACKRGTKEVFNYGANLRKYGLKMDYICKAEHKKEYMEYLSCYQDILNNETLQQCDYIYKDLKPWLYSVSAFQFYCKDSSEDTQSMQIQLDRLRGCYHRVFQTGCGDSAGTIMNNLIGLAFQDPAYLRYTYLPDCSLHRKSSRLKDENEAVRNNHRDFHPGPSKGYGVKRASGGATKRCDIRVVMLTLLWLLSWKWADR